MTANDCEICGAQLRGLLGRGTVLQGRYRVEQVLGVGGYGAVYLAQHLLLEHPIALKALFDTTEEAQRQFRREAQLLVKLRHPGLATVSDSFIEADGIQYLAMEYVEGPSLVHYVDQGGPAPAPLVADWARQLLDVLTYIHGQTPPVMHRDIKPGNIIIKPDGRAVLVDFGIAKAGTETATTMAARAISPGFSPPEQYGQGSTTPRSDLYALGATLYFVLTATVPPDSLERAFGSAAMAPISSLAPDTPPALEDAIETALRPKADERWQNAAEFAAALTGAPATVAIRAPATMAVPQTIRLPEVAAATTQVLPDRDKQRRQLLLGGGLAALALVAALIFVFTRGKAPSGPAVTVAQPTADPRAIALPPSVDVSAAAPITLENAATVTRTAQIGRPALVQALFAPGGGGQRLAVATTQNIEIYGDTGKLLLQIPVGRRSITALEWSGDGKQLAVGRADGLIQLRQASDGKLLRELEGHTDAVNTLAWDPFNPRLASGGADLTIKLWDTNGGKEQRTLSGHTAEITDLSWKSDGGLLASGSADSTVRIWNAYTGAEERQLQAAGEDSWLYGISDVTWSDASGDPFLAAAYPFRDVRIWRVSDWQEIRALPIATASYGALDWKPFETELAIGGMDGTIFRYNLTNSVSQTISTAFPRLGGLDWRSGELAVQSADRLAVMDEQGAERWSITGFQRRLMQAEWSPDGAQVATRSAINPTVPGWVQIWDVAIPQPPIAPISSTELSGIDWNPETKQLLIAGWHDLSAWQPGSWQRTAVVSTYVTLPDQIIPTSPFQSLFESAWNPAGDRVATVGSKGELAFWKLDGGTFASDGITVTAHADTGRGIDWNPAGTRVATTADDGFLRVWDAETHEMVWESPQEASFQAVGWSPDGKLIATTTLDSPEVKIWDAETGAVKRTITFKENGIRAFNLAWSPDGTMLATANTDRRIRLWNPAAPADDGALLAVLGEGTDIWRSVAWHPQSKALVSAGEDGTLFIWSIPR
ncbi:MAG TPA: protein kinase [Herpetosiphonaceae bacterium]